MTRTHQGQLQAHKDWRVAIVASRFNELVTSRLIAGAVDGLVRHGLAEDAVDLFWVPGAFEIPAACRRVADKRLHAGIICLGAVIRGSTPHFEYVAAESAKGIAAVSAAASMPVIYGVLTTENIEQALERAGTKAGNKGFDAAAGLIEMINLFQAIDKLK